MKQVMRLRIEIALADNSIPGRKDFESILKVSRRFNQYDGWHIKEAYKLLDQAYEHISKEYICFDRKCINCLDPEYGKPSNFPRAYVMRLIIDVSLVSEEKIFRQLDQKSSVFDHRRACLKGEISNLLDEAYYVVEEYDIDFESTRGA